MKRLRLFLLVLMIGIIANAGVVFAEDATLKPDENGIYWYYNNGEKDFTKSGLVSYNEGSFIVIHGKLRTDFNGMCNLPETEEWYFFSNGQVQKDAVGFAEYDNAWFYLSNGELDRTKTGIYEYDGGKFLLAEGRLLHKYSGLYQNTVGENADGKWYFFANGQLQEHYTGLALYDGKWFYLTEGCLNETYTGNVEYDNAIFYIVNGMLAEDTKKMYTTEDITGMWEGHSVLRQVQGTDEMISYLETLYDRELTEEEKMQLASPVNEDMLLNAKIYTFEDSEGNNYPASWFFKIYMNDFMGYQTWDDWAFLSYEQFLNGEREAGCIRLDYNNYFKMSILELDKYGAYGGQVFNADPADVEGAGQYGVVMDGTVSETENGNLIISGTVEYSFQYGDMENPYVLKYDYVLDAKEEL